MRRMILLGLALLAVGCTPESVAPSPDGKTLAIAVQNAVYLTNQDRKASEPIEAKPWSLTPVVWLPDGKSLLVVHRKEAENWAEVEKFLGPAGAERAKKRAAEIVEAAQTSAGEWETFDLPNDEPRSIVLGAWNWLGETRPQALKKAMKGDEFGNSVVWEKVKSFRAGISRVSLFEVDGLKTRFSRHLYETMGMIWSVRIAPDGKSWVCVTSNDEPQKLESIIGLEAETSQSNQLLLHSLSSEGHPRRLAGNVGFWPAWALKSDSLYFFAIDMCFGKENKGLGSLRKLDLSSLSTTSETDFPSTTSLLNVVANPFSKLTAMPDGRLLVITEDLVFPNTLRDKLGPAGIYFIDPNAPGQMTRVKLVEEDEEISDALILGTLNLSPDGKSLAFTTQAGQTGVLSLRKGTISWASTDEAKKSSAWGIGTPAPVAPTWLPNGELVFIAPANSSLTNSRKPELVQSSPDRTIHLSESWPWFSPMK